MVLDLEKMKEVMAENERAAKEKAAQLEKEAAAERERVQREAEDAKRRVGRALRHLTSVRSTSPLNRLRSKSKRIVKRLRRKSAA